MLTTPITTPIFRARVLTLVSNYLEELGTHAGKTISIPIPTIPSFSPFDTPLVPSEIVTQLLAVASPWIDLSSPDPVIYNISRQVLELEVAYAAFCGIGNIILPSPKLHHGRLHGEGITQYAYAIQEALNVGQYTQLSVSLSMMDIPEDEEDDDNGSLAALARSRYMGLSEDDYEKTSMGEGEELGDPETSSRSSRKAAKFDFFGTWDAWNVIRTVCKYSNRLFVGKNGITHSFQSPSPHMNIPLLVLPILALLASELKLQLGEKMCRGMLVPLQLLTLWDERSGGRC